MAEKVFFADIKGVGTMINAQSDYDEYRVRVGQRTDRYDHSETIQKKQFKGMVNGKSAKEQAFAFVEEVRKSFEPKVTAPKKRGAR